MRLAGSGAGRKDKGACFLTGNFSGDIGGSVLPKMSVPVDIERVLSVGKV